MNQTKAIRAKSAAPPVRCARSVLGNADAPKARAGRGRPFGIRGLCISTSRSDDLGRFPVSQRPPSLLQGLHRARLRPWAAIAVLLLAACGGYVPSKVVTGTPLPPAAGFIVVAMESAPVPDTFVEIAILQVRAYGTHATLQHVVEGLQTEARALGCTAVVRVRVDQGSQGANGVGVCGILKP